MNRKIFQSMLAVTVLLLAGCSSKGPDVIDPNSQERRQISLFAIDNGSGFAELLRFSEQSGIVTASDYATANGGEQLDRPVDGIYDYGDRLYLHHRVDGSITVLDLETRKKAGRIDGFPYGAEGRLTAMAFSNLSQAWVVCHGAPTLYEVDQVNMKIAHTVQLPYFPSSVGAVNRTVFVGMVGPDSTGKVGILSSNPAVLAIEQTLDFPTPIIYMFPSSDNEQCLMLSAGGNGAGPTIYYVDVATRTVVDEYELDAPPLLGYIGMQPNYAGYTRDDYLYLATPSAVIQYDVQVFSALEWIIGSYPVIGVDSYSGLLYAYDPTANIIRRHTFEDEELPEVGVPQRVNAIRFLGSNRVIR